MYVGPQDFLRQLCPWERSQYYRASHVLPEQKMLADLEFKNRDVDNVSHEELLEDRIRSLELRLALHRLNV